MCDPPLFSLTNKSEKTMTTENIIRPEREDNQQPPVTPTRCVLNHIFAAALTSFTAICNQFQPQEVVIRDFEAELDINNSSSDITITPSDREPHLGLSSGENHNEESEEDEGSDSSEILFKEEETS